MKLELYVLVLSTKKTEVFMSFQRISIDDAKALIDSTEVTLADIRDLGSFQEANIPNSVHINGESAEEFLSSTSRDKPLIVYCYHGNTSKGAANYFFSKGFTQVYSMDGGFEDWRLKY
jgi:thiosulfate sulfurtransferase